jgi:kinesin family protein 20
MIVHVNPYDTGFDENAHVMRFSAIAREIQTTAQNKVAFPTLKKQLGAIKQAVSIRVMVPVHPDLKKRPVQSLGAASNDADYVMVEEELEVIEGKRCHHFALICR